jgi:hypothetical protein
MSRKVLRTYTCSIITILHRLFLQQQLQHMNSYIIRVEEIYGSHDYKHSIKYFLNEETPILIVSFLQINKFA